jgi:hypothetical protein
MEWVMTYVAPTCIIWVTNIISSGITELHALLLVFSPNIRMFADAPKPRYKSKFSINPRESSSQTCYVASAIETRSQDRTLNN